MFFNTLPYDPEAPKISFVNGILTLSGKCHPSDAFTTFAPIIDEFNEYSKQSKDIIVNFKLDYLNTSSNRFIVQIINVLNSMIDSGGKVEINWFYEEIDERMEEQGEDMKYYFKNKKNFNLKKL